MNFPLPFYAHPLIKASEHPSPIPIVWHLLCLVYLATNLITPYVSSTYPSVNKNICFGYP